MQPVVFSLLGALGLMSAVQPARAAVIYELQSFVTSGRIVAGYTPPFALQLTVSEAAVRRGRFVLSTLGSDGNTPPIYVGDITDFVALQVGYDIVTPTRIRGRIDRLSVSFAADGSIAAFDLAYFGDVNEARLVSVGSAVTGTFGLDTPCSAQPGSPLVCTVSGRLEIPEPLSLGVLGVGIALLAAARRRWPATRPAQ